MKKPKVNVNILTWNASKYLKICLESVLALDYPNFEILVIDNDSQDDTKDIIQKYLDKNNKIRFIENKKNLGFALGHNQGIKKTDGKYILVLNQDALVSPDFLSKAVEVLENDEKIAALQPKILKYDFKEKKPKDIFDTTGLLMLKNRRILNRGQGEKDNGQFDKEEEIFGADGAAPIYRRLALEETKIEDEYFDSSFFAYKEDVDLAWRLKLYGWKAIYIPSIVAYHERGAGESASRKSLDILKERKKISLFAKRISFKNQRLMQIKNEILSLYLYHFIPIIWKEIRAWGYVLFFEPRILKILPEMLKSLPKAFGKRRIIMKKKKIGFREMKKWFS